MPKFVVAFISFFDNELHQEELAAKTELEAAKKFLVKKFGKPESGWITEPESIEDLKHNCFYTDSMISALRVK